MKEGVSFSYGYPSVFYVRLHNDVLLMLFNFSGVIVKI